MLLSRLSPVSLPIKVLLWSLVLFICVILLFVILILCLILILFWLCSEMRSSRSTLSVLCKHSLKPHGLLFSLHKASVKRVVVFIVIAIVELLVPATFLTVPAVLSWWGSAVMVDDRLENAIVL